MYYLASVFPLLHRVKLPLTRDQLMLLMVAVNQFFLGLDIYLAHSISGTIVPYEWIPIIFGPIAGVLLVVAGAVAIKNRFAATILVNIILLASIIVGLLGAYFHVIRAVLPTGPIGARVNVDLLVWAPPILGPLTFSLIGLLGLSAVWLEDPVDSGQLTMLRGRKIHLPYSKTQAFLFMVGLGTLATLISSVLDHARTQFQNPWLWVPIAAGVFGTVVAVALGSMDRPSRRDIVVYVSAMTILLITGVVGALLHIREDLTPQGTFVLERFIRGAPILAPLLFANMGTIGFIAILNPQETESIFK